MKTNAFFGGCVILLLAAGCSLPPDVRQRADAVSASVADTTKKVSERKTTMDHELTAGQDKDFLRVYAEREKWSVHFQEAEQELVYAQRVYDSNVAYFLKRNREKEAPLLLAQLQRVEKAVAAAKEKSQTPGQRMAFLLEVRAKAPELLRQAGQETEQLKSIGQGLEQLTDLAKTAYADHASQIAEKFAPLQKAFAEADAAYRIVWTQLDRATSDAPDADYAQVGDSCTLITQRLAWVKEEGPRYQAKIGELYHSYTKTLVDMRAEYFVQIVRVSWDEDSDWPTEHEYVYPAVQVEEPTFEYFDDLPDEAILATTGFLRNKVLVEQSQWDKLKLDQKAEWPSSWDDSSEFGINELFVRLYHKYEIEKDGQQSTTDWVKVDEQTYEDHFGDLGMAIVTKPVGVFEEEKLQQASPPGMAYVGNPQYGQWKQADNGDSFWEFYGKYRFFSAMFGTDHYYHRSTWDDWRTNYRGRKPYYGDDDDNPRYGTYAGGTSSGRYRDTVFARSGGFTEAKSERASWQSRGADPSVRGAGPSSRGRGPGGGGK